MKLKTTLTGRDGHGTVHIIVKTDSKGAMLTRMEQEAQHNLAVNNAHAGLRARFDVRAIDVKRTSRP